MKITRVTYSAVVNLGDYQNEQLGMTARLEDGEDPAQVIEELRAKIEPLKGSNANALDQKRYRLRDEVQTLERKLERLRLQWEQTAQFLKAQGIQTDPPTFPNFDNLLLPGNIEVIAHNDEDEEEEEDEDDHPY